MGTRIDKYKTYQNEREPGLISTRLIKTDGKTRIDKYMTYQNRMGTKIDKYKTYQNGREKQD